MSEPQSNEVWKTEELKEEPKGGFGVAMTPEQFTAMMNHMNYVTEETSRREQAVADSLDDLKKVEVVRTYAQFVKDITTSIQTLSMIPDTEDTRNELLKTLTDAASSFSAGGALSTHAEKQTLESKKSLQFQTDSGTAESPENPAV